MSERERWIVYPLLFLALGAALRDKLISSTESQRIKCQGLMVYDSSGQVSMVLGAEQFPNEIRQPAHNMLTIDQLKVIGRADAGHLDAKNLTATNLKATNLISENLKATNVISDNLSMGNLVHVDMAQGVTFSISGPNVIRQLAWLDQFQQYFTRVQTAVQQRSQATPNAGAPQQPAGASPAPGGTPPNAPAANAQPEENQEPAKDVKSSE